MEWDVELIVGWLRARSVARGLPTPVADHGGWRVDTQQAHELRRYVFAQPEEGLRFLAASIDTPRVYLKLSGSEEEMRPLLTPRWQFDEPRYVMTGEDFEPRGVNLAAGYSLQLYRGSATVSARIVTSGGVLAASGYAAEVGGVFIYDQINTAEAHRRRGLASCVMQALRSTRRAADSTQILVATEAGQGLYESLGWRTRSPYTTAHIQDQAVAVVDVAR
jgi:hypothetical protein